MKQGRMVPAVAHFIWYGRQFWWVNALAIRSAVLRGGFDKVVLHHDQDLGAVPAFAELSALDRFEARRLVPEVLFGRLGAVGPRMMALHEELDKPNARANVVRAAILLSEGGVYLDTDTITVRSLEPLRRAAAFCGLERVVLPVRHIRNRAPHRVLHRWGLMAVREAYRQLPDGWRRFRGVEGWYPLAVNNAVLGAVPDHPLLRALVTAMVDLPAKRRLVPYALGTHLLQDQVGVYDGDDLVLHPPSVFYPLGPEISHHWFRLRPNPPVDEVMAEDTRVVHWYMSVRTRSIVPKIDADYVRANADRQLFSALAARFLEPAAR